MKSMDDIQNRLSVLSQDKMLLVEALKKRRLRGELQEPQGEIPSISRAPRNGMLPLSFAQQRMWLLHELDPDTPTYNDHLAVRFTGRLNIEVLERSFAEVIRRHETLRTSFQVVDGQPVQVIAEQVPFALPVLDLRHYPENEREIQERNLCFSEVAKPFDLARGPVMRTRLLQVADAEYVLIIVLPHIIFDGWSRGILVQELTALYEAYLSGRPSPLAELPIQYADFACWQREWLQGEVLDKQVAYWREQLGGELPTLDLPADHPRPAVQSYRGANLTCGISKNVKDSLEELGRKQQSTLFIMLLAAFQALLHRYTGQEDLVIGVPTANRTRSETERLIGAFVNTLALRVNLSSDLPFQELLSRTRKVALEAQAYQDVPFEKLVELLSPQRDLSRTPLFQVMFVLQNVPMPKVQMPGVNLSHVSLHSGAAQFDLTLFIFDGPEGSLIASVDYNTDLFEAERILRMLSHFQVLLEGIVADPEQRLANLSLLTMAELRQLTHEWNDTQFEYAGDACIHELFEAQVARCPEAAAVLYEDTSLTYSELDRRANQLANYLRKRGTGPETLIGICIERSLEMVIGLLAILKSGAAYVPLDPGYPAERLSYMLSDSGVRIVVTQNRFREIFSSSDGELICLDENWAEISCEDERSLKNTSSPQNLAYVIYTSGSTGKPKGAMNTHGGLRNRLEWMQQRYQLEVEDRVLQKTPFTFDVSVWEFFWPLLTGAQLVMARPGGHQDSEYLIETIGRYGITTLHFVPPMLQAWLGSEGVGSCTSLRRVICSGEALSMELQRKFQKSLGAELHNLYGPTEASIDVTYWDCQAKWEKEFVPIGKPIANTQTYVLDQSMQIVPVGIKGELYIGGAGLARGYLNRPELTAEKFVPNRFSERGGERLYRTGDLTRYHADGSLEFLGRLDHQVKIRGYRIELGEVEEALREHPEVEQAVVVVREDQSGDRRLVGYVVGRPGAEALEIGEVRSYLRQHLPEYMVPGVLVALEKFPLNASGKIDRRSLPKPELGAEEEKNYVAPRSVEEEILSGIFGEVLGRERVGVEDNFFEIGGHSLLATQVISRVRRLLGAELPLRRLFEWPTVAGLAQQVRWGQVGKAPLIERVSREQELPLSFAQQRLWFLNQLVQGDVSYNIPGAVRIKGELKVRALERSLGEIVRRHESLRTRFLAVEGEPRQVIDEAGDVKLALVDLRGLEESEWEAEVRRRGLEEALTAFDLSTGPLLRMQLLSREDQEHVLLLTMHHIVSDGWSMGVLVREVTELYEAYSQEKEPRLLELPIQYVDYSAWQREWLRGEVLEEQLGYWKQQLAGLEALDLPTDRVRPAVLSSRGARESVYVEEELLLGLRKLGRRQGATLYMTLLAVFQVLLYRYSGQKDIGVGTPIAGRTREETEGLIGLFVNTLVMRTRLEREWSYEELLERVKQTTMEAYGHQDVPFEKLVEELAPQRDLGRTPLFQVMLVLQNAPVTELKLGSAEVEMLQLDTGASKFEMTLLLEEAGQELRGILEYNSDLFEGSMIQRMMGHCRELLRGVLAEPGRGVGTLGMLSAEEREQLVVEWNRTEVEYGDENGEGRKESVHEMFEVQAEKTPEAVALEWRGEEMRYGELNRRANRLAHYLRKKGVRPEVRVGICVERGMEMVVAMLGVLKAGGAYVPLDGKYPEERQEYILRDAEALLLVTDGKGKREELGGYVEEVLELEEIREEVKREKEENPGVKVEGENLGWVIYTSGSTGRPKGAGIRHSSGVELVKWGREVYSEEELSGVVASTSICFDLSVFELFVPLSWGGRVMIAENALEIGEYGEKERVRLVNTVPSAMAELVGMKKVGEGVRTVNLAGEALEYGLVEELYRESGVERVVNLYGPTEDTTYSTYAEVRGREGEKEEKEERGEEKGEGCRSGDRFGTRRCMCWTGRWSWCLWE